MCVCVCVCTRMCARISFVFSSQTFAAIFSTGRSFV